MVARGEAEQARQSLEARAWESEAERLLDRIGVRPGARCIDLGCGAEGLLGPLSRRAGPTGRVLGVDADPLLLAAARAYADRQGLANVQLLLADVYQTRLSRESFDVVHARFLCPPPGRDAELMRELASLVRPRGALAVQEPDSGTWSCRPEAPAFGTLRDAILAAAARAGEDLDAGRRVFELLRETGLQDVRIRAAVLAFQDGHPYMEVPLLLADSLRTEILRARLLSEGALDRALAEYGTFLRRPGSYMVSCTLMQAWGRKAAR